MKLVIQTQYLENYNCDNPGEGNDYWKPKGGSTYVVEDVDPRDARIRIVPEIKKLIEYDDVMSKEYIIDVDVVEDDKEVCQEWEAPVIFEENFAVGRGWQCKKLGSPLMMDHVRGIIRQREFWIPTLEGGREDGSYKSEYELDNGQWVDNKTACEYRDNLPA